MTRSKLGTDLDDPERDEAMLLLAAGIVKLQRAVGDEKTRAVLLNAAAVLGTASDPSNVIAAFGH